MKFIQSQKEIEKRIYTQYGVILETNASALIQGMRIGNQLEGTSAFWP